MSYQHSRQIGRKPPGRPALINPDHAMMLRLDKAPAGTPKQHLDAFKLAHLLSLEYAAEKDGTIKITHLGRHWLSMQ